MKLLADAVQDAFGKIAAPSPIQQFLGKTDPTGTEGVSKCLSNLIAIFYTMAAVTLIFMLLWGGWDWITSEGDKEKVSSAQKKILNAIIGIILFAAAFAVIQVFGQFTGFKFFEGQK